jgi:hypothetical protein
MVEFGLRARTHGTWGKTILAIDKKGTNGYNVQRLLLISLEGE